MEGKLALPASLGFESHQRLRPVGAHMACTQILANAEVIPLLQLLIGGICMHACACGAVHAHASLCWPGQGHCSKVKQWQQSWQQPCTVATMAAPACIALVPPGAQQRCMAQHSPMAQCLLLACSRDPSLPYRKAAQRNHAGK